MRFNISIEKRHLVILVGIILIAGIGFVIASYSNPSGVGHSLNEIEPASCPAGQFAIGWNSSGIRCSSSGGGGSTISNIVCANFRLKHSSGYSPSFRGATDNQVYTIDSVLLWENKFNKNPWMTCKLPWVMSDCSEMVFSIEELGTASNNTCIHNGLPWDDSILAIRCCKII